MHVNVIYIYIVCGYWRNQFIGNQFQHRTMVNRTMVNRTMVNRTMVNKFKFKFKFIYFHRYKLTYLVSIKYLQDKMDGCVLKLMDAMASTHPYKQHNIMAYKHTSKLTHTYIRIHTRTAITKIYPLILNSHKV